MSAAGLLKSILKSGILNQILDCLTAPLGHIFHLKTGAEVIRIDILIAPDTAGVENEFPRAPDAPGQSHLELKIFIGFQRLPGNQAYPIIGDIHHSSNQLIGFLIEHTQIINRMPSSAFSLVFHFIPLCIISPINLYQDQPLPQTISIIGAASQTHQSKKHGLGGISPGMRSFIMHSVCNNFSKLTYFALYET
jgi:hypothetical protein